MEDSGAKLLFERWSKLVEKSDVVVVDETMPIGEVLDLFKEKGYLSFPVVGKVDGKTQPLGLVDMIDMCSYVLKFFDDNAHWTSATFNLVWEHEMAHKEVKEIMNCSGMDVWHPLRSHAHFDEVLDALTKAGVHRVPLLHTDKIHQKEVMHRFVTQTEVIRFLGGHLDEFGELFDKNIAAAGLAKTGLVSIPIERFAFQGFQTLVEKRVSALPVVDESGALIDVLSVKDMRQILGKHVDTELMQPLSSFLKTLREGQPERTFTIGEGDTVRFAITLLQSNRVHRLWIVNKDNKPLSVVSLSDIFNYILDHPHPLKNKEWIRPKKA